MNRLVSVLLIIPTLISVSVSQQNDKAVSLESLVAAEKAFAKTSVEKGVRASFIEYFADDGIGFGPHPMKMKKTYLQRPAPAAEPSVTLNWWPVYADVSRAGDLGYTTGPSVFTDQSPRKKPPHYGFYFSIWKKQPDGVWKVVVDCGIDTPDHSKQHFGFKSAGQTRAKGHPAKGAPENERAALSDIDRKFMSAATTLGPVNAYLRYLADETRLHRNGTYPVIGKDAARSLLKKVEQFVWVPIHSDGSQSNDLGYTYGSYELKYRNGNLSEKGYYVRVWKRDEKGDWKVTLDSLSPIPPEEP